MKWLAIYLSSIFILVTFVSCVNSGQGNENIEISFWHMLGGKQNTLLEEITAEFMEKHSNIKVDLTSQSNYNKLSQKLSTSLLSPKDLPTMTQAFIDWTIYPIQDNLIVDIMDLVMNKKYAENSDPAFVHTDIAYEFVSPLLMDGSLYGMPFAKSSEVLWYNKDLFERLELEVPTTFEELVNVSKKIYEETGIPGAGFDSLSNYFYSYLNNLGITFNPNDVRIEDLVNMADYYLKGIEEKYFMIAGAEQYLSKSLGQEQLAMYFGSTASESFILEYVDGRFNVGVAPYLEGKSIKHDIDLFIFSSASEVEQLAAWEYIKFLLSEEIQLRWAVETGYLPVKESVLNSEEYLSSDSLIPGNVQELFNKPIIPNGNAVISEIELTLEKILSGDGDRENMVKHLQNLVDNLSPIWTPIE
ncbi:MAG: hypothetical protein ATN31_09415 [Candidatus Epulonipiscioides saccharophilum]|nr:MAG: hypothetical protein ATN31_09415 [Epulopiscium sp. AS2M-Bin001]